MAKKHMFCLVDTETTIDGTVADFAALIVDRKGRVYHEMSVLVAGHYGVKKLFYDVNSADEIWTLKGLEKRNRIYQEMLDSGTRMLASPEAINKWIATALNRYPDLVFTAYNADFDLDKMKNTGIAQVSGDLPELAALHNTGINIHGFKHTFCLWKASVAKVMNSKAYVQHCIDRKWFTAKLNLRTNAEAMAEFVKGKALPPEPHTALEDARDYELPILTWLVKDKPWHKHSQHGYNWREWQIADRVKPK